MMKPNMVDGLKNVFNIPAGQPFLRSIAETVLYNPDLDGHFAQKFNPEDFTIFLPTKRSVRFLKHLFLQLGDHGRKSVLLPTIMPIGDIDITDIILEDNDHHPRDIPPVFPDFMRKTELLTLVRKWGHDPKRSFGITQVLDLTMQLSVLLNELQYENIDFDNFNHLVPESFSENWQETFEVLKIILQFWPLIKQERNMMDASERRILLMSLQAEMWKNKPPIKPIIMAGSTGSIPSTAKLLSQISCLPLGCVILSGLDTKMSSQGWALLKNEPAHPQAGFFNLLKTFLKMKRQEVRQWTYQKNHTIRLSMSQRQRIEFINHALCPAQLTEEWKNIPKDDFDATTIFENVTLIEAADIRTESGVIALAIREALETPSLKTIFVTSNRFLARWVAAELKRWNIEVDDSAGIPLARYPIGVFIRLIVEAVVNDFTPISLMSILKHPFTCLGMTRHQCLMMARLIEKKVVRGTSYKNGLKGLYAQCELSESVSQNMRDFLIHFMTAFRPLTDLGKEVKLSELASAIFKVMQNLFDSTVDNTSEDSEKLWLHEQGDAAYRLLHELMLLETLKLKYLEWLPMIEHWLGQEAIRTNRHPRISIMGLLEARLIEADFVILGGLNEGSWPAVPDTGAWLSRAMRHKLNMSAPEKKIGLSAHDFVQLSSAQKVLWTRAKKENGMPMMAARWITKIQTLAKRWSTDSQIMKIPEGERMLFLWQRINAIKKEVSPNKRPDPCPKVELRPKELPVTQIDILHNDPYAIYARYILKLRKLDALEADLTASMRGSLIHKILEKFVRDYPNDIPTDISAVLKNIAAEYAKNNPDVDTILAYWWSRFDAVSDWFEDFEKKKRKNILKVFAEIKGSLTLDIASHSFKLTAKADRIEILKGGGIAVLDYKTGPLPKKSKIITCQALQMPLEGAIAQRGGFDSVQKGRVKELTHIRVHGAFPAGEIQTFNHEEAKQVIQESFDHLNELLVKYMNPDTPYISRLHPKQINFESDYDHLARVLEWSTVYGDDE